jgi:hypothetical protein
MIIKKQEVTCEICGKKLEPDECYSEENHECLCWDCWQNEEEEDDGILFI